MKNSLKLDSYSNPVLCGLLADRPTTLSQAMHNAGFKAANLPFSYIAIDTKETKTALDQAKERGFRGLSLTIPHKEQALSYLDHVSDEAKEIEAVNTIIFNEEGLTGYNTDWLGIVEAFKEALVDVSGKKALIFGAGGAARAAIYALKKMNAAGITVVNRTDARAARLAQDCDINSLRIKALNEAKVEEFDIFINSTPIGSKLDPNGTYPFDLQCFNKRQAVFDMVTAQTSLIKEAKANRAVTIAGERMLLFQALEQFRLFTEQEPPRVEMEKALKAELCRK